MRFLAITTLCIVSNVAAYADTIAVGASMPHLSIADKGELILQQDKEIVYQPWDTSMLVGKVQVLQYQAARSSANSLNEPFNEALRVAKFPAEQQVTTILVNTDDVMWGTSALVGSGLESNKKKYPQAHIVADARGEGLKAWGLKREGSAIAVLDKTGKVIFYKEGALSSDQIKAALALIQRNL